MIDFVDKDKLFCDNYNAFKNHSFAKEFNKKHL